VLNLAKEYDLAFYAKAGINSNLKSEAVASANTIYQIVAGSYY
jgi:hypothetical protein